ncbi:glycosyltransferase family 2 protein [Paenibacillus sp. y28]|uniref:glycosyltransferase family 2 protein n=1 Tax=Paenibacillus sp. y28 TaxID=3129110 RepID=UPI00301AA9B4
MKTSIIIPSYNGAAVLRDCIRSIRVFTPPPYEILVVDNGSTDETLTMCREERVPFLSLPENRGFPAACNAGLRIAGGDALMLLNNDVLATRGWLDNMKQCLLSDPRIGLVGPMSNYASGRQQIQEPFTNIEDMSRRWNVPNPGKWKEVNRLVGLCLLFRREVLEQIGPLDERFTPGHYEDDDYCYRVRQAGYRLMIAGDVFLYHHGSASFGRKEPHTITELIRINKQKFIDKWGVDPAHFM